MTRPRREPQAAAEAARSDASAPLAHMRAVFFDLDGCLWFGDTPAEGATELVEAVRASGRRVGFVSNISGGSGQDIAEKLRRLGFVASADEVIVPVDALAEHPRMEGKPVVYAIGNARVIAAIERLTRVTRDPDEAELVVLSRDRDLTYDTLTDALQPLLRGVPLLSLNVDARVPAAGGRVDPGAGAIAAALETAAGIRGETVGKPSAFFFRAALRRLGARAEETVMVGDTLDSDIAGGNAAGMITVRVGDSGASALQPAPVADYELADVRGLGPLLWGGGEDELG